MTIQTDGVIMPGMLDLHGHPEFNVFAPWEPPKSYVNRYSWRGSKPYQDLVRTPQNELLSQAAQGLQLRYAEIRALVGGVTAIQGASIVTQKGSHESMVRNVDGMIFGEHRARAAIDLPTSRTGAVGRSSRRCSTRSRTTRSMRTTCTSPRACATTSVRRRSSASSPTPSRASPRRR